MRALYAVSGSESLGLLQVLSSGACLVDSVRAR